MMVLRWSEEIQEGGRGLVKPKYFRLSDGYTPNRRYFSIRTVASSLKFQQRLDVQPSKRLAPLGIMGTNQVLLETPRTSQLYESPKGFEEPFKWIQRSQSAKEKIPVLLNSACTHMEKSFRNVVESNRNQVLFTDGIGMKPISVWFQINLEMVNTI